MGGAEASSGGQQQSICCIADIRKVRVLRAGQIWLFCRRCDTLMGVIGEGVKGYWSQTRGGGEKVSMVVVTIGSRG